MTLMRNDLMKNMYEIEQWVREQSIENGYNPTSIESISLYKTNEQTVQLINKGNPYVMLIVAGTVRFHTPSGIMDYLPGQYMVSAIDTPDSGTVLIPSKHDDFLAVCVNLLLDCVINVVMEMDGTQTNLILTDELSEKIKEDADRQIQNIIKKMLVITEKPEHIVFMEKHIMKELVYYLLCGSSGIQFLRSTINIQRAGDIYKANSWIKENYRKSFSVEDLAAHLNMSVSVFHQKFKTAIGMGPLQCQKRLRLTEARRQMMDENSSVTEAALDVGYESISQFNRDYKKMFGAAPKQDILKITKYQNKSGD